MSLRGLMEELNSNYIDDVNEIKKYWWLYDSFWHAAAVKEFGIEKGNKLNLEVNERTFSMLSMMWRRNGSACNAYESVKKAGMTEGYEFGCQALRNGVMKALRLKPLHTIEESLVNGDGRCVITFEVEPQETHRSYRHPSTHPSKSADIRIRYNNRSAPYSFSCLLSYYRIDYNFLWTSRYRNMLN